MSYVNPIWREGRRRYWQRHDWQRFIRHDAHRFLTPAGIAEEKRAAEAETAAQRRVEETDAAEREAFEQELLDLRWEVKKLKLEHELWCFEQKYSPDQPRVPAGNSDGGQWTSGGGQATSIGGSQEPILSDASPDPLGSGAQAKVIRICLVGSSMITTDRFGNQSWWADYVCADGFTFRRFGTRGKIRGFEIDWR